MDFYINSYLPSQKKNIDINKMSFGDFFQLNAYIQNSDNVRISDTFDSICEKSIGAIDNITNLDKFYTLVNLYRFYINPLLKISAKNENAESVVCEISLKMVLNNCEKYEINGFNIPSKMYYDKSSDILHETGESYENIEKHIYLNKIQMYEVPDFLKGVPKAYLNSFDNSLFYFCKLLYRTDLKKLYKKIGVLKKNFNFLISEI
jgi:hypothetical protein